MENKPLRIISDTNILISAILFGGKPREILHLIHQRKIVGVSSPILLAELADVLSKKFKFEQKKIKFYLHKLNLILQIVHPQKEIHVLKDEPDNRVLEAAIAGNCNYIITGDKELLKLKKYKQVKILKSEKFLRIHFKTFSAL